MLDVDQLLSLGIVTFSLLLTGASLIAYHRTGLRKFFIVSLAFLLYAVKELVEHVDIVFPDIENSTLELMTNLVEFLVIALFFAAVAIKEGRRNG
ncbi:hypothetical protein TON_0810 [Thermococcus onnurineus NA1]|uniref:Uncharacterized protein n=1 Tax=Thermococcus onnurineus (strain NA1) TaxID=523850 RepID=B6YVX5_THEON|nr:DUF5985 family protein [Thermococcus onnurineus]ACJ16298.1 hypothetical protein TON_0810 [Thermococcus onnurineus NA1]